MDGCMPREKLKEEPDRFFMSGRWRMKNSGMLNWVNYRINKERSKR